MDYAITFALLMYINVFYFGLYAAVEFFLLVFKCYQVSLPSTASSCCITSYVWSCKFFIQFIVIWPVFPSCHYDQRNVHFGIPGGRRKCSVTLRTKIWACKFMRYVLNTNAELIVLSTTIQISRLTLTQGCQQYSGFWSWLYPPCIRWYTLHSGRALWQNWMLR